MLMDTDGTLTTPLRPTLSGLLKGWRQQRKLSQLDLALHAGVSQRHLSFIESGRAQPSRDLLLMIAEALNLPLRERNALLNAAGYVSLFEQRSLSSAEMEGVRQALEVSLAHHNPYPAMVIDRQWNTRLTNQAAVQFISLLGDPDEVWARVDPSGNKNVMRLTFSDQGLRPCILNWEPVAAWLLVRLHRELTATPTDQSLKALYSELLAMPGVSSLINPWKSVTTGAAPLSPTLNLELGMGDVTLKMFSMISTFGTALDVTADELRIEAIFPADAFTKSFFEGRSVLV